MELALQEAVSTIRSRSDGAELTVKQVHAELVHDAQWASVTLSEVKRASSKVAKASKQANVADLERPMQEMKVRRNFRAPLGWSEPITSREPFSKSPDAAEYAEMRRIIAGFKGAEDGASPEEQSEFVLDAMCTCANDAATRPLRLEIAPWSAWARM